MKANIELHTQAMVLLLTVILIAAVATIGVAGAAAQFSASEEPTLEQTTSDAVVIDSVESADRSLAGQGFGSSVTADNSQIGTTAAGTNTTVTVVDGSGEGENVLSVFESELPNEFITQVVEAGNVDAGVINETDVFVFNELSGATGSIENQLVTDNRTSTSSDSGNVSPDATELITTVENDFTTGAVYLDQASSSDNLAIPRRSDVIGDPNETFLGTSGPKPIEYVIQTGHPIFDGVGIVGDTVPLYTGTSFHSWFTGTNGETLAEVQTQAGSGGPAVTVDPNSRSVLLSSLGIAPFLGTPTPEPGEFTDEASQILANAVEVAVPPEADFFSVTNLTAPAEAEPGATINVSATVTNLGNASGTQDVEFVFNGSVAGTVSDVSLAPGENTTVEFTDIQLPELNGSFEHRVSTANDSRTTTIQIGSVDPNIKLVNFTQPDTLPPGETITTEMVISNNGTAPFLIEVLQATNLNDTEPVVGSVTIPSNVTTLILDPGESATVQDTLYSFGQINADPQFSTDFEPGDEVLTGYQVGYHLDPTDSPAPNVSTVFAEEVTIFPPDIFEVSGLTAPAEAGTGEQINVSATITNTGNLTGTQDVVFEFDGQEVATKPNVTIDPSENTTVEFTDIQLPDKPGFYNYRVFTANDSQTASIAVGNITFLTVVDGSGEGENVLSVFESELPDSFATQVVDASNVNDEVINATDVFVFNDLSGTTGSVGNRPATGKRASISGDGGNVSPDATDLITTVESDLTTGAVYLDQASGSGSAMAIPSRSDIIGDPNETFQSTSGPDPVEYAIQSNHPIFDGVGIVGDTVTLYSSRYTSYSWFADANGETLAEVQDQTGSGGPAVAVDPDSGSVLLSSLGIHSAPLDPVPEPGEFTDEASQILANAVEVAVPSEATSGFFSVSNLTAPAEAGPGATINVSATVTNLGNASGTQDVEFVFNGSVAGTVSDVSLAPGENTTVEFTDIQLPDQPGTYEHGVSTVNDSQTAEITVLDPAFFAVSNLTAPAEAGPGDTINVSATITNTGNLTGTQDVVFEFAGQELDTEPTVQIAPGENTTVEFSFDLPEQPSTYEHGVFTANDSQTAQIIVKEVGPPSLPGSDDPPQDPDGDGLYEDTDGDGEFDIFDVQAFFVNYETSVVQNNVGAFDFDGDSEVDIFDVQGLFNEL